MVSVQASRFALLNIDDDSDSEKPNSKVVGKQQQQNTAGKKKNKKKRKGGEGAENDQLRSLAFNKNGPKRNKSRTLSGGGDTSKDQWDEWKRLDAEHAADSFEKDLEAALLQSKIEHEEVAQVKKELEAQGIVITTDGKQKKKKIKQQKGTMSLTEFQKLDKPIVKTVKDSDDEEEELPAAPSPTTQISNPDPKFFDNVETDVHKILQKEKIQEQYKQNYAIENIRTQKYQEDLDKKCQEIETLKKSYSEMEKELKQVKKRNQQLCHILSQGEMKDKTKILMELDELRQVREELTEEVTKLNTDLEKERSKVHQLQNDKSKGGKHSK